MTDGISECEVWKKLRIPCSDCSGVGFWFCTAKRCSSDSRSVGRFGPTTGPKGRPLVSPRFARAPRGRGQAAGQTLMSWASEERKDKKDKKGQKGHSVEPVGDQMPGDFFIPHLSSLIPCLFAFQDTQSNAHNVSSRWSTVKTLPVKASLDGF